MLIPIYICNRPRLAYNIGKLIYQSGPNVNLYICSVAHFDLVFACISIVLTSGDRRLTFLCKWIDSVCL